MTVFCVRLGPFLWWVVSVLGTTTICFSAIRVGCRNKVLEVEGNAETNSFRSFHASETMEEISLYALFQGRNNNDQLVNQLKVIESRECN